MYRVYCSFVSWLNISSLGHGFFSLSQEIIQNADDAGATEVKFYLDCRHLSTLPRELASDYNGDLDRFQGPALMAYNNAPFLEEDWEGIQNLQQSGKAENPHKVGKFGIGFNSVYHISGKAFQFNDFVLTIISAVP